MNSLYLAYTWFNWDWKIAEDHEILFIYWKDEEDVMIKLMKQSKLPEWFHLDFLLKYSVIDGYEIQIKNTVQTSKKEKLYFGYMWAEAEWRFIEDHELLFVVSENEDDVKAQLKDKTKLWIDPHVDYKQQIVEIDWKYIHLKKNWWNDKIKKVLWYTIFEEYFNS